MLQQIQQQGNQIIDRAFIQKLASVIDENKRKHLQHTAQQFRFQRRRVSECILSVSDFWLKFDSYLNNEVLFYQNIDQVRSKRSSENKEH
jgi:allophanate hydrolase subunit 1